MRKALFITSSFILLFVIASGNSYGMGEKRSFSALKYNYVVETNLSLSEFSEMFFERLKTKHQWAELSRNVCEGETCVSSWSFTDEESHKWKCDVTIQKAAVSNQMMVTMEMNPVLGS
jgi:hypothetical protein